MTHADRSRADANQRDQQIGAVFVGDSPAEIRHLVEQAQVYADEAIELLDLIGVGAGSAAIDIRCGVLGVLHLIAERVGADGRVVGLDRKRGWWNLGGGSPSSAGSRSN